MGRPSRQAFEDPNSAGLIDSIGAQSAPLDNIEDLDPLMERIGNARFVLLGEATHGTAEYYEWRRLLSERLIREKQFSFIAVEGDWPDCYRVNRYIKGRPGSSATAAQVLHQFERWPTWMWANDEVVELAEWLHEFNHGRSEGEKVGFYGLDVYSLWESMDAVLSYLLQTDGRAADAARIAYECFEPYGRDEHEYARATVWAPASCEDDVVRMLHQLRLKQPSYAHDGREDFFNAEQNAIVARNAEHYYRTMVRGGADSWNIRDGHMVETLNRLVDFHGDQCKAIIWEHNTHIGDARYTDMAADGMFNVGQLMRQQHEAEGVVLIGFSSYRGTVIAGDYWGAPMRKMPVPPARAGSWEDVLHRASGGDSLLIFDQRTETEAWLEPRRHRAIGVVYRPDDEARGNYVPTVLPHRYDALIYLDETRALRPLRVPADIEREVPETYPSGV